MTFGTYIFSVNVNDLSRFIQLIKPFILRWWKIVVYQFCTKNGIYWANNQRCYSFDFVNTELLSKDDFRDYVNEFIPKSTITTEIESEKKKYNIILIMIIAVFTFAIFYVRGDYEKFSADLNSVFAEDKIIEDACKKGKD